MNESGYFRKAFKDISQRNNKVTLEIAGKDGWKNQEFWNLFNSLSPKEKSRIIWHKYLERNDLLQRLSECRIFVFCSIIEGFGLPILEAMSFAKPLVLSDTNIHREVAGDAAIYFEVGNYDELANILIKLLADESELELMRSRSERRFNHFASQRIHIPFLELKEK